jgi:hypothetical protein
MPTGLDAVQIVISYMVIFPPRRIMQRVGPGVAPMSVKAMRGQGRPRAAELEDLVGRKNGYLGGQRFRLRCRDRGFSNRLLVRRRKRHIDQARRFLQGSLSGVQPDF